MAFNLVLFAACVALAQGGLLQQPLSYSQVAAPYAQLQYQQGIAAPFTYHGAAGGPLASVYRIDRPLEAQLSAGPYARYAPGPIAAPLAPYQVAHLAPAHIATPIGAQIATGPIATRIAPIVAQHNIAPVPHLAKAVVSQEYDPNPQYTYSYEVQDALTGDNKNQIESRNGDVVQGSYSLNDPDGTRRTVEYTADPINGFNAVVHKEPLVAKAVVTPAIAKVHAPIGYSPIAQSPLAVRGTIIH